MYDNRLLTAAQQGDEAAFAALYDRNVEALYDFCRALTGDDPAAARVVAATFALAARHLREIVDSSQLRPWLLAIARDRILAEDEAGTLPVAHRPPTGDRPGEPLAPDDLRRWARDAAATLALADQMVLELALRHDLDADQLASAIGCPPDRVESVFIQVQEEAEQVLGALLLARQARRDCPELADLIDGWDETPSVAAAEAVSRHAEACDRCARRWGVVNPLELIGAAPVAPIPANLRNRVLDGVVGELARLASLPGPASADTAAGYPGNADPAKGGWPAAAAGASVGAGASGASYSGAGSPPTEIVPLGAVGGGGPGAGPPTTQGDDWRAADPGGWPAGSPGSWSEPDPRVPDPLGDRHLWTTVPGSRRGVDRRVWIPLVAIAAAVLVVLGTLAIVVHAVSSRTGVVASPKVSTTTTVPAPSTSTVPAPVVPPPTIVPIDPSTTTSTSTTLPGSRLQLNTTNVDLGTRATTAQLSLSDAGAAPTNWRATTPVAWLTITPAAGLLQPGASVPLTLAIDRTIAPPGAFSQRLSFLPSDTAGVPASVSVVGTNAPGGTTTTLTTGTTTATTGGPVISGLSAAPATIAAVPCPSATQSAVSATVTDPVGVASATLSYFLPDGRRGMVTMTRSGDMWSAVIGGATVPGTITYQVTATDLAGQGRTSASGSIAVVACTL